LTHPVRTIKVVAGEFDYLSNKETTEALVNDIPGAKKVEMDGVGHWHAVEDPVGLASIFDAFFLPGK
jgi:pimeloyl-ACP methyl ester carboxylesterase